MHLCERFQSAPCATTLEPSIQYFSQVFFHVRLLKPMPAPKAVTENARKEALKKLTRVSLDNAHGHGLVIKIVPKMVISTLR